MLSTCPNCHAEGIDTSLRYCSNCGESLHGGAEAAQAAELISGPKLVVQDFGGTREHPLAAAPLTLGRAPDQQIVLSAPFVSERHALIAPVGGDYQIQDVGSVEGLLYRGKLLTPHTPHRLVHGDVIRIGDAMHGDFVTLTYSNETAAAPQVVQRAPLRIEARGLMVEVPDTKQPILRRLAGLVRPSQRAQKTILRRVSLCVEPGEFVALVGGSGAGKSTLMRALSGFSRATGGSVQINGSDFYSDFDAYRALLGYVPQDDIVHRMLPVSRALGYAARLRLSEGMTTQAIDERIGQVLDDVEMGDHRVKRVDDLSGGQRKRVSIASELLADPSLFFLDEPTSGLDPGLEKKMMFTLRRLADEGRTVMLVTHATANIAQCDLVAFMAAGRLVYYGPPGEALPFFGVTSQDFADIYTRLEGRFNPSSPVFEHDVDMQRSYQEWKKAHPHDTHEPWLAELWEMRFLASPFHQRYVQDRLGKSSAPQPPTLPPPATPQAKLTQSRRQQLSQFWLLTRRYTDLVLQDRSNLLLLLLQAPIIAALLALVSDSDAVTGGDASFTSARTVMFMLAIISVWFGIINAAREITKEAAIYRRERLANLHIVPYVASKVIVLSGLVLVQSFLLLLIVRLKVQMPEAGVFLPITAELFITTVLSGLAGLALGLLISTVAATPDRAISVVPLALIPQIIFSGVIFKLSGIASALSWLAIGRWSMDAYGAVVDLNARLPFGADGYAEYTHDAAHLIGRWVLILVYMAVCLALTVWVLQRRDTSR